MIRIAVVDDQEEDARQIAQIITQFFHERARLCQVVCFASQYELLCQLDEGISYSLYLIDVRMPGMNGLRLGRQILDLLPDARIVFITHYPAYAVAASELRPYRYLTKSGLRRKLPRALEQLEESLLKEQSRCYVVRGRSSLEVIPQSEIYSIVKQGKHVVITHRQGETKQRITIQSVWTFLDEEMFFEIGRGMIINLGHVRSLRSREVTLSNHSTFPVSRPKLRLLKERIEGYWHSDEAGRSF